ncbi:MAG: FCD domain-containing protein, partial [Pseudomonadota bacterium]
RILPVSADDMREIYGILIALEPEVAAQAARNRTTGDCSAALEQAMSDMEVALEERNLETWADADDRYHRALLDRGENNRMTSLINTLFDQAHRARMVTLRLRSDPRRSTQEHRQILDAILDARADDARALFRAHRERTARELLRLLEDGQLKSL